MSWLHGQDNQDVPVALGIVPCPVCCRSQGPGRFGAKQPAGAANKAWL